MNIKSENFDELYDRYINTNNCELCEIELEEGIVANGRCLDHNHETGLFRNVLCRSCNSKIK